MAITPAEIIQRRRAELGLTQAQLAERLGRAPSTVRRWEKGEAVPPDSVVPALATALQVEARDLAVAFGIDEEPSEDGPSAETSTAAEVAELPTEAITVPVAEASAAEAPAKAATAVAAPPQKRPPRRSPLRRAAAIDRSEGLSYIEDNRQRIRYWLRAALTIVLGIILLLVLIWAFGELRQALGDVWDLFGEDTTPVTSPGTDF